MKQFSRISFPAFVKARSVSRGRRPRQLSARFLISSISASFASIDRSFATACRAGAHQQTPSRASSIARTYGLSSPSAVAENQPPTLPNMELISLVRRARSRARATRARGRGREKLLNHRSASIRRASRSRGRAREGLRFDRTKKERSAPTAERVARRIERERSR